MPTTNEMLGFTGSVPVFQKGSHSSFIGSYDNNPAHCTTLSRKGTVTAQRRVQITCGRRNHRGNVRKGDGRRPNRVAELIRREISGIIDDGFSRAFANDDHASSVFVSVVDVKCSEDLRSARVSVSVMGSDQQKGVALQWLRKSKKELRYKLAQTIQLKYVPELTFSESEMGKAMDTMMMLDRLAKEREVKRKSGKDDGFGADGDSAFGPASHDALILDDLEMDDVFVHDDEDEDDEADIVHIDGVDEELSELSDDEVRRTLYNTLGEEDFARR